MNSFMYMQRALLGKALVTIFAFVRFLSCMCPFMYFQVVFIADTLATMFARRIAASGTLVRHL